MENKERDIEEGSSPLVMLLVILLWGVSMVLWVVNLSSTSQVSTLHVGYFLRPCGEMHRGLHGRLLGVWKLI